MNFFETIFMYINQIKYAFSTVESIKDKGHENPGSFTLLPVVGL